MHTGSVFFFIKCWPYTTNIHCIALLIFFYEPICGFLLLLQEDMYFLRLELDPSWCTVHWQLPLKRTGSGGMKVLSLGHLIKSCSFHFSLSCLLPPNCHPPFFSPQCMDHPKMISKNRIWHSRNKTCELLCCLPKTDQMVVLIPRKGIFYTVLWVCAELFDKELVMFTSLRKR